MPRTIRPAAGVLTVKLYEPLTQTEEILLAADPTLGDGELSWRLPGLIENLSRRWESDETCHSLTDAELEGVLHALADCRRREYIQRDRIHAINQKLFEYEVDGIARTRYRSLADDRG